MTHEEFAMRLKALRRWRDNQLDEVLALYEEKKTKLISSYQSGEEKNDD